jgi:hypothetical protein
LINGFPSNLKIFSQSCFFLPLGDSLLQFPYLFLIESFLPSLVKPFLLGKGDTFPLPFSNEAALKAQAAAGFRREGYLRRHSLKNGVYRDVVLLAILAEEWLAARGRVLRDLAASGMIRATS